MVVSMPGRAASAHARSVSIFAIDPGEDTGWAWACVSGREIRRLGPERSVAAARDTPLVRSSGAQAGDTRFLTGIIQSQSHSVQSEYWAAEQILINALLCDAMTKRVSSGRLGGLSHVVVEDFELRRSEASRSLLSPVRLTARLHQIWERTRALEEWRHLPELDISQKAAQAKNTCPDDRLERWGLYVPRKVLTTTHERDAIRHLVLRLRRLHSSGS